MFGVILKATNSSLQKDMTVCHSIYEDKVMKLLAFIFEQPSYKTLSLGVYASFPFGLLGEGGIGLGSEFILYAVTCI